MGFWQTEVVAYATHLQPMLKVGPQLLVINYTDVDKQKIIGTATLLIELKFIRSCGKVRGPPARLLAVEVERLWLY